MKLIEHVLKIRGLIQQAVENSFARFGAPENIISTHQVAMGDYDKARMETVKECVFTFFNRLAALKVMEDRELFPEVKEDIRNTYNYIRANESCILSQKYSLMRLDVTVQVTALLGISSS